FGSGTRGLPAVRVGFMVTVAGRGSSAGLTCQEQAGRGSGAGLPITVARNGHKTGTSSLHKHKCSGLAASSTRSVLSYFGKSPSKLKLPNKEEINMITKMAVKYVSKDLRSFQSIAGEGFLEIAQCLIDIGSRSGRVDAKELLPDPTTVSRNLKTMASEVKTKLIPELKLNLSEAVGAATLDMWTDDYRKIEYLCLTIHYIEKTWCLRERVLCTTQWDSSLKKTGENIKSAVIQSLRKWNSLYMMFDSIHTQYDQIKDILVERSEEHRLDDLNNNLIENIVKFLEPFKQASDALEASSKPTLYLTIVWFKRLEMHLKPSLADNIIILELKAKCLRILKEKFQPHLLHKMALFFHPKLKSLKLLDSETEKTDVRNEIKKLLNEKHRSEVFSQQEDESQSEIGETAENNNKRKNQDDLKDCKKRKKQEDLFDVEDSSDENLEPEPDELE
ncbi:hypothetical protein CBL_20219, partial [Carabus blaptoides fortunei]